MPAYSFPLDLFQLTRSEFAARYGWKDFSETDFLKLRADAGKGPHSTIISSGAGEAPAAPVTFTNKVLTGFKFVVNGTNVEVSVLISDAAGSLAVLALSTVSGGAASSWEASNLEVPITSFTVTVDAGTPYFSFMLFGYTPPTTSP